MLWRRSRLKARMMEKASTNCGSEKVSKPTSFRPVLNGESYKKAATFLIAAETVYGTKPYHALTKMQNRTKKLYIIARNRPG